MTPAPGTDMGPVYQDDRATLYQGDALNVLPTLPEASVDSIVVDPPYEISFMGKSWDGSGIAYNIELWRQCLRVLKPGGHLVAFGGTRTYHRMACAVEDVGFEIRDSLHWIYGSGFPKSHDVSKAIDKAAGAEREVIGHSKAGASSLERVRRVEMVYREKLTNVDTSAIPVTAPATDDAARWQGWGTALKPAHEPIVIARRPLEGTVAGNVLTHGTGALNIDGCRVSASDSLVRPAVTRTDNTVFGKGLGVGVQEEPTGRWPANVVLTHSPLADEFGEPVGDACADGCVPGCPVAELDTQSGVRTSGKMRAGTERSNRDGWTGPMPVTTGSETYGDTDGASRFFPVFRYQAKAPAKERPRIDGVSHPTVKPLALMRWLVRLVTPPGGTVLDWCAGSGTTVEACLNEGFTSVAIERNADYIPLCLARIARTHASAENDRLDESTRRRTVYGR